MSSGDYRAALVEAALEGRPCAVRAGRSWGRPQTGPVIACAPGAGSCAPVTTSSWVRPCEYLLVAIGSRDRGEEAVEAPPARVYLVAIAFGVHGLGASGTCIGTSFGRAPSV